MNSPDQYLMQVLRRSQLGLQESLLPHHAEKCDQLFLKFEQSQSLRREAEALKSVRGFTKAALTMEWIMIRVDHSREEFSSDQFESDTSLMNETFFEAFLSEPFEPRSEEPFEPIQEQTIRSDGTEEMELSGQTDPVTMALDTLNSQEQTSSAAEPSTEATDDSPGLADLLDQNFMLAFQRFTAMVLTLTDKTPDERKSVLPLITMIAKGSVDVARGLNRKELADFFQSVVKFLSFVNGKGLSEDDRVAVVLRDLGERLLKGLNEKNGGAGLLHGVVEKMEQEEAFLNT